MSAVPFAESVRVAEHGYAGHTSTPALSRPRRQRCTAVRPAAQPVIERIHGLMQLHGITLSELGAAYAVSRIRQLMALHGITFAELRAGGSTSQQPPQHEVRITRCPSLDHDPRYQLPPGTRVMGPFTSEWQRLRGVAL